MRVPVWEGHRSGILTIHFLSRKNKRTEEVYAKKRWDASPKFLLKTSEKIKFGVQSNKR